MFDRTKLEAMLSEAVPGVNVASTPVSLEKGDSFRGVFIGIARKQIADTKTGELKAVDYAMFFNGQEILTHMGVMLMDAVRNIPVGASAEVTMTGYKKTAGSGSGPGMKVYTVKVLNVPQVDPHDLFGDGFAVPSLPAPAEGDGEESSEFPF